LLQLHKPLPCGFMTIERQRVDKARNLIAMNCLNGGFDYLFFVDDDNPIPADALEKLLEDDKDVVSGVILSRNPVNGRHPICGFYEQVVQVDGSPLRVYNAITEFKDKGPLHRVEGVGTGCTLIKRKVLEKLSKRYKENIFEFGDVKFKKKVEINGKEYDRRTMSEDAEFSERAVDAGFELWMDDRVRPIHLTTQGFVQWQTTK